MKSQVIYDDANERISGANEKRDNVEASEVRQGPETFSENILNECNKLLSLIQRRTNKAFDDGNFDRNDYHSILKAQGFHAGNAIDPDTNIFDYDFYRDDDAIAAFSYANISVSRLQLADGKIKSIKFARVSKQPKLYFGKNLNRVKGTFSFIEFDEFGNIVKIAGNIKKLYLKDFPYLEQINDVTINDNAEVGKSKLCDISRCQVVFKLPKIRRIGKLTLKESLPAKNQETMEHDERKELLIENKINYIAKMAKLELGAREKLLDNTIERLDQKKERLRKKEIKLQEKHDEFVAATNNMQPTLRKNTLNEVNYWINTYTIHSYAHFRTKRFLNTEDAVNAFNSICTRRGLPSAESITLCGGEIRTITFADDKVNGESLVLFDKNLKNIKGSIQSITIDLLGIVREITGDITKLDLSDFKRINKINDTEINFKAIGENDLSMVYDKETCSNSPLRYCKIDDVKYSNRGLYQEKSSILPDQDILEIVNKIKDIELLENAKRRYQRVKSHARKYYDTHDPKELKAKIRQMDEENERQRAGYQATLDKIEADLAAIGESCRSI